MSKTFVLDEKELLDMGVTQEAIDEIPFGNVSIYSYTGDNLVTQTKWCMDGWTENEADVQDAIDNSRYENADELLARVSELDYDVVVENMHEGFLKDRIEEIADDLHQMIDDKVLSSISVDDILGYLV